MYIMSKSFHGKVLDRVKSFSDGVFSIVMTILVLQLRVPSNTDPSNANTQLGDRLLSNWPTYVSFTLSFCLVCICCAFFLILAGWNILENTFFNFKGY